eukprot:3938369-Rhodomonas_salina.1
MHTLRPGTHATAALVQNCVEQADACILFRGGVACTFSLASLTPFSGPLTPRAYPPGSSVS